jgi:hypothetical protein
LHHNKRNKMKKNEILKGLSQVQQELIDTKLKLNNLVSSPIWDTVVTSELDDTVTVLRGINDNINDIIEIQKKIAISRYNKK